MKIFPAIDIKDKKCVLEPRRWDLKIDSEMSEHIEAFEKVVKI